MFNSYNFLQEYETEFYSYNETRIKPSKNSTISTLQIEHCRRLPFILFINRINRIQCRNIICNIFENNNLVYIIKEFI